MLSRFAVVVLVSFAGCGDDGAVIDAGDAATDAGLAVTPPDIPWDPGAPVELGPCPEGWRMATERDPVECDPYGPDGLVTCASAEAHFPGEADCRPVGPPCPAGDFADALPTDGPVVYVHAGAAPGGDGSMAAPHATLAEVPWTALATGTTVAIAKGRYEGVLPIEAGTRVIGACASETMITGVEAPVPAVVSVVNAGEPALVANLQIADPPQRGVSVAGGRALRLEGVVIDGASETGILAEAEDAMVTLDEVIVDGTRPTSVGSRGVGIVALGGGRVEGRRVAVRGGVDANAAALSGGEVSLTDSVLHDAVGRSDGTEGRGVVAQEGGHFEGARLAVEGNRDVGVFSVLATSTVTLEDVMIRDTRPSVTGSGRGISVQDGARLDANRLVVANSTQIGVFVSDPVTVAAVTHAVIRDTQPHEGILGRGANVRLGGRFEAANTALVDNRDIAVVVSEGGSHAVLNDVLVARTTHRELNAEFGRGVEIQEGGSLEASGLVLAQNHDAGLLLLDGATGRLDDVVIRSTQPRISDDANGLGMVVQAASVEMQRVHIEEMYANGVFVIDDARADFQDFSLSSVTSARCATTTCADRPFGYGVTVIDSDATLDRFTIDSVEVCGILLVSIGYRPEPANVDLTNGAVTNSGIGACVQVDGYDLDRLTDGVHYGGNDTNLDITSLPVPESAPVSESL